ncbi:MAG: DUF362 domain-containing protein, partial [Candidatus Aminicenantales bacterium]
MRRMITRRDFMKGSTFALLSTALGFSSRSGKKSRVVLIRHREVLDANSVIDETLLEKMLDEAVAALFDAKDGREAFRSIVKPDDVVGIKSNVWSYLPTPRELEKAIVKRLLDAGVRKENISIDDHNVRTNPVFKRATSLINVRPLRTHYLAGMSGCLKNYIMFAESQPAYHPDSCAQLGALFHLPQVKGKTRLHILCALTPQFHGRGPHHFSRRYIWSYRGLFVGQDPVAVDTMALKLIMAKRAQVLGKARALPPVPKHIRMADVKYGIGTSDPRNIELI